MELITGLDFSFDFILKNCRIFFTRSSIGILDFMKVIFLTLKKSNFLMIFKKLHLFQILKEITTSTSRKIIFGFLGGN